MKVWTAFYTFDYPWEMVARAACRKYPNPCNTAVIGTDVIERKVVNGTLYTHKLVATKWRFPTWAHALIGYAKICFASERSEVDPNAKEMVVKTKNLTFYNIIDVDETIRYTPDPQDANKTLLTQEAVITVRGVPLTDYMEELLSARISLNAMKGRQGIEYIAQKLEAEVKELANSASNATNDLINETRRQFQDLKSQTKRSINDLQNAAKKSFDKLSSQ